MRLLIDNALSPQVSDHLKDAGFDSVHVRNLGLQAAEDTEIFERAIQDRRVVVSADTDFAQLLALRATREPFVILFRRGVERRPRRQADLLIQHLPALADDLKSGSIVVLEEKRIRIRSLPVG